MDNIMNVFLWILIATGVSNSTNVNESIKTENQLRQITLQCKQEDDSILSCDYLTAKKALEKALQKNDKATLRLGLRRLFSFEIKMDIAKAISQLKDKSFIPNLIDALEKNQGTLSGGTETGISQALLSRELIVTIEGLTGLKFNLRDLPRPDSVEKFEPSNYISADEIQRVIKEVGLWWEVNKNEFQENEVN